MITRGLGSRRRGYRRGQSLVLFALATLVVITAAIGPLYERAVEQASIRSTLTSADRVSRGLVVSVDPSVTSQDLQPTGRGATLFQSPVHTFEIPVAVLTGPPGISSTLVYRDNQCAHVPLASGHCPVDDFEVMISARTAAVLGLHLGSKLPLKVPHSESVQETFKDSPTIVGLFKPFAESNDYWFGSSYSTQAGITQSTDKSEGTSVDAVFGSQQYMQGVVQRLGDLGELPNVESHVDLALRPDRVGVDDIPVLRHVIAEASATRNDTPSVVQSALPAYLDQVQSARKAARTVVFAGAASLILLALIGFGVAVAAAADQRRPELALARLRGNGVGDATRLFISELGTLALAAIAPGVLLAWALGAAACRVWLVSGVKPEVQAADVGAVAGALVVMFAMITVIGRRASGQQITDMLRQLPSRRGGRGLGIAEAVLLVAAIGGASVVLSGGRHSSYAALMPTFVALVLGVIGSRLLVLAARSLGRRAFWRGGLVGSLAAFNLGRRSGARLTITVLCVATALLVFAGQQWSVASANRHQRAAVQTGAAVRLTVTAPTVQRLLSAVHAGDSSGHFASPVFEIDPPGVGATPVLAVDPASFDAVANWGRSQYRPSAKTLRSIEAPTTTPPVTFTGSTLQLTLSSIAQKLLSTGPGITQPGQSVSVQLDLRRADGLMLPAVFGPLPTKVAGSRTFTAAVSCTQTCHLAGLELDRPVLGQDAETVAFTVTGLKVDGSRSLSIGRASDWVSTTERDQIVPTPKSTSMQAASKSNGLRFTALDGGSGSSMQYLELPVATPALLAGARPQTSDGLGYLTASRLDGGIGRVAIAGTVPFAPEAGSPCLIIDANLAARTTTTLDPTTQASVWLRNDDAGREAKVVKALNAAGIKVIARTTTAEAEQNFAKSAPGWSAQFALVVGVLAEILAIGLLILSLLTTRRVRQRDLAALRLAGFSASLARRSTALELAIIVLAGVVTGAVAGVVGAVAALPAVPVFTAVPTVPLPSTFEIQSLWLAMMVAVSVIALVPVAAVLGSRIAGRARADHAVREGL